ncbi:glycoside hydrolase family 26 protein [Puerhibacterium sp. TATVAM-FAB25]|uniref:glycoside hydrolase family 26 protein n=1 Tax=Puerhibacterium sp. TATVAM-FAB25 TaxID=3093699 RepID=UPI00397AF86F
MPRPAISTRRPGRNLTALAASLALGGLAVAGCGAADDVGQAPASSSASPTPCPAIPPDAALPAGQVTFGVNPDWGSETLEQFTDATQLVPGAAVSFVGMPLTATDAQNVTAAAEQVGATGGVLMLTLEPHDGLAAVTDGSIADLTELLAEINATGVPVLVRFAHEMNGSWYAWGQQPEAYVATFRRVAAAVHDGAPASQMLWAPNYGGGYPFAGGRHAAEVGTADGDRLDVDGDGELTQADDPYAPYYPGDDAVDWVGMSLYHWGSTYPWGEDEVPEEGKFAAQLTGTYDGLGGDDRNLPDFYATYTDEHGKPLAIPETAAFVTADADPDLALEIKRTWWRQVFSDDVHVRFPDLRLVNWFDWDKHEVEVDAQVRWSLSGDPAVAEAFRADLPSWVRTGPGAGDCS